MGRSLQIKRTLLHLVRNLLQREQVISYQDMKAFAYGASRFRGITLERSFYYCDATRGPVLDAMSVSFYCVVDAASAIIKGRRRAEANFRAMPTKSADAQSISSKTAISV